MIGRLVEQQQVGFLKEKLCQRDAHLPAAGKFFRATPPIGLRKSKATEHAAHLGFERVTVPGAELAVETLVALRHAIVFLACGIELGHLLRERFHLALHVQQVSENRHALGKYAAARKRQPVLRQIARRDALGRINFAVIKRLQAGEDFEKRRLARAVRAHDSHTVVRRDQPVKLLKKQLGAKTLPCGRQLDHWRCVLTIPSLSG